MCYWFILLTACPHGYFGLDCLHKCSTYCRGNGSCNHITGVCDEGCKDGLSGSQCGTNIGMSKTKHTKQQMRFLLLFLVIINLHNYTEKKYNSKTET